MDDQLHNDVDLALELPDCHVEYCESSIKPPHSEAESDNSSIVTVEQAIQGLLKAITFLQTRPAFVHDHVQTLWNIINYIQTQGAEVFEIPINTPGSHMHHGQVGETSDGSDSAIVEVKEEVDEARESIPGDADREEAECDTASDGTEIYGSSDAGDANCEQLSLDPVKSDTEEERLNNDGDEHYSRASSIACTDCEQYFENDFSLKKHVDIVHGNDNPSPVRRKQRLLLRISKQARNVGKGRKQISQQCHICDKHLSSRSALILHVRSHSSGKDFKCEDCDILFKSAYTLRNHKKRHVEQKCETCSENFHTRFDLRKHMKTHDVSPVKNFKCADCGRSYKNEFCLQKHINKKHTETGMPQGECMCTVCDTRFINIMDLHHHRRKERHYQCVVCKEGCTSMEHLISHMNSHDNKNFPCKLCEKMFTNARSFVVHTKLHTGEQLHQCTECGKLFLLRGTLSGHMREHMTVRTQACCLCDSKFFLVKELKAHYRRCHSAEKRFMCTICGKRFRSSGQLGQHARVHTGEKNHVCPLCSKRYCSYSGLQVHIRTHTGERPSHCDICDKSFIHSSDLKRHMIIHTGEKPHECKECGKRFTQASNLRTHMRTHTGQKPYKCTVCFNSFGHAVSLRGHMKLHDAEKYKYY